MATEKTRWIVGSNMPGYMPDDSPFLADSYEHAIQCMIGDLENDRDDIEWSDDETEDEDNGNETLEAEYNDMIDSLEKHLELIKSGKESPEEQGITIGDRHYFVSYAVD